MNAVVEAKTHTRTEEEHAAWKKAVAELKARIKDLAKWQSHNKIALKENQRSGNGDQYVDINGKPTFGYSKECWEQEITVLHIVYNRLRNRPIHTKDDEAYINSTQDTAPELCYVSGIHEGIIDRLIDDHGIFVIDKGVLVFTKEVAK